MYWWLWVLLGLLFLVLELATPGGFYMIFLAIAAMLVGAVAAFDIGTPLWLQVLLFSAVTLISMPLLRPRLLAWVQSRSTGPRIDTVEGDVAILQEDLAPGAIGKAELRGTTWTARNADTGPLSMGQRCQVVRVDGLTLWVRGQ